MTDQPTIEPWPELMCVLCGQIVMFDRYGSVSGGTNQCSANGGADHIPPGSPGAERAKELHAAWLRDPFGAPTR